MMRCYTEAASSHYKMIKAGSPMKMSGGLVAKVLDSQSSTRNFWELSGKK